MNTGIQQHLLVINQKEWQDMMVLTGFHGFLTINPQLIIIKVHACVGIGSKGPTSKMAWTRKALYCPLY